MEFADQQEEIQDFSKPGVLEKYRQAAAVAQKALQKVSDECQAGRRIVELCNSGDAFIVSELNRTVKPVKTEDSEEDEMDNMKGVAFPTCISVGNCAGHFSPLSDDQTKLAAGDIVKIDLGVHVGGWAAVLAHTLVVPGAADVTDKRADVVAAAYMAFQSVARSLRPGVKNTELSEQIERVAKAFGVTPLEGVLSHVTRRFVIDGEKIVMNHPTQDQRADECEVEALEAWAIDVVMSSSTDGKARDTGSFRPTVFKADSESQYLLKLKASRATLSEIRQKFSVFPFTLRALSDEKRAKLGVGEMVQHGLLDTYPVLFERAGETVAQFKGTLLVGAKGTTLLCGPSGVPQRVRSDKSEAVMAADAAIRAALGRQFAPIDELAASLGKKKKKKSAPKRKAAKKEDAEAAAAPSAAAPLAEHPQEAKPMDVVPPAAAAPAAAPAEAK